MASTVINGVPQKQKGTPKYTSTPRATPQPPRGFPSNTNNPPQRNTGAPQWEFQKDKSYGPSSWAWGRYLFRPLIGSGLLYLIPSPLASPTEDQIWEFDDFADTTFAPAQLFGAPVMVPSYFTSDPQFMDDFATGNVSRMQAPNLYLMPPSVDTVPPINGVPIAPKPNVPMLQPSDALNALIWQVGQLGAITSNIRREIKQGFNHIDWTMAMVQSPAPVFNQTSPTVWTQNTYGAVAQQYVYSIYIADVTYNGKTYYGRSYYWIDPADAWIYEMQADAYVNNMNAQMQNDYNTAKAQYDSAFETYEETLLTVKLNNAKMTMDVAFDPVSHGTNARQAAGASGRKQPPRNRKGRDRKMKQFAYYGAALSIINNTIGKGSEALEVWDAFFSNLEAKPMRTRPDQPTDFEYELAFAQHYNTRTNLLEQGIKMKKVMQWYMEGKLELNVEGFLKDLVWNKFQDYTIGRMSQSIKENINQDPRYGRPVGVQFGPAV